MAWSSSRPWRVICTRLTLRSAVAVVRSTSSAASRLPDDPGDRRRLHVLVRGQLAQRERSPVLDGGQRGLLRRGDARRHLLAQPPGQAQHGQAGARHEVVVDLRLVDSLPWRYPTTTVAPAGGGPRSGCDEARQPGQLTRQVVSIRHAGSPLAGRGRHPLVARVLPEVARRTGRCHRHLRVRHRAERRRAARAVDPLHGLPPAGHAARVHLRDIDGAPTRCGEGCDPSWPSASTPPMPGGRGRWPTSAIACARRRSSCRGTRSRSVSRSVRSPRWSRSCSGTS